MTIHYSLKEEDYLELLMFNSSNSTMQRKKRQRSRVLVPIIYIIFGALNYAQKQNILTPILFVVIGILWFIAYPKYSKWANIKHFKKHIKENYLHKINQPATLTLEDDYIISKDDTSEVKISYSEIKEVSQTLTYYFLTLTTNQAFTIPIDHITDPNEFKNAFLNKGITIQNRTDWKWS